MVAADLRTRGRLRDGHSLEHAASADLDDACRRVADAYDVPLVQVRRAVEIRVDTVVSRGFGVLAVNAMAGRLEPSWLVHRNDRLPIRTSRSYGTIRSDQTEIQLTVVEQQGQAESSRPEDAKVLIVGEISGIPPGFDEGSEVRVTFEMGFDGVLHVTAFHVDAGIPLTLTATTGATLSQAEVAREREQLGKLRRRD
jgi:molecular chaperone DnaK (HSP70)